MKVRTPAVAVLNLAMEVIQWFNNHSRALGLLHHQQMIYYGKTLALLRPALTRWTAHFSAAGRLLETQQALRVCILTSKPLLISLAGKERAQIEKAEKLLSQIEHPEFWQLLAQ